MVDILLRSAGYVAVMVLGYLLRRWGVLRQEDFRVLSTLVIRVTLPAAVIINFSGKEMDVSMLSLTLLGLLFGCLGMASGYLLHLRGTKEEKAFAVINYSAYNIGNFTMPFVQSFLGPVGVIATSLFDVGNAMVCLGGSASVAHVVRRGGRLSVGKLVRSMSRSVSLITYVIMTVLTLCHITLPATLLQWVSVPASANVFLSMLMIGVGFSGVQDAGQWRALRRFLLGRYGLSTILAAACWFVLPFGVEIRRTLVVLLFAPVASANLPFTREIEGDVSLASAMSSVSVVCSIPIIVALLSIMG
jgi:predicted permease